MSNLSDQEQHTLVVTFLKNCKNREKILNDLSDYININIKRRNKVIAETKADEILIDENDANGVYLDSLETSNEIINNAIAFYGDLVSCTEKELERIIDIKARIWKR